MMAGVLVPEPPSPCHSTRDYPHLPWCTTLQYRIRYTDIVCRVDSWSILSRYPLISHRATSWVPWACRSR